MNNPIERLRHHVTGAIERGEAKAITEQPASWIIYNRNTGKAVFETFEYNTFKAFNDFDGPYQAMPILEWLQRLNTK